MRSFLSLFAPRQPQAAAAARAVGIFRVRTGSALWLAAGAAHVEMRASVDQADGLVAMVPEGLGHMVFLVAEDLRTLTLHQDGEQLPIHSAWGLRTDAPALVRLRHPLDPARYLTVTRPGEGDEMGQVLFAGAGDTMLSVFGLQRLDPPGLDARLLKVAREIGEATAAPLTQARLLTLLRERAIRLELGEALLRLLPEDEQAALARAALDEPEVLALLQRAMPADRWLQGPLPALAAWVRDRDAAPAHLLQSPAGDAYAAEMFETRRAPDLGGILQSLARRQVLPRRRACILATARNEGPYLLEWVAYHLSIGFEHIFLYTNDDDDQSGALLDALAAGGVLTHIRNETTATIAPQYKAYAHALRLMPQILDYRWTAVIDIDEYIGFDTAMFVDIGAFIAFHETQPVDAIAMCWLMFTAQRGQGWSDQGTLARFTARDPSVNAHVKTLFRTAKFAHAQAHHPRAAPDFPFVYRTETGFLHHHAGRAGQHPALAEAPGAQLAWINHYCLRSAKEALWKRARARGGWTPVTNAERVREKDAWLSSTFLALSHPGAAVEDTRILSCASGQARKQEKLLALPGVAALDAQIKAAFPARLREAACAFLGEEARPDDSPDLVAFRALIADETQ